MPSDLRSLALETDEARAAAEAASAADGRLLLVPKVEGRFATVGTVAQVDQAGELPNGVPAGRTGGHDVDDVRQVLAVA
ncbi:MAG: hypothetical protein M3Q68_09030, partial [Actinomycetota bacterium]|nr:hypothetical protein [Actinomycetota bacterium]